MKKLQSKPISTLGHVGSHVSRALKPIGKQQWTNNIKARSHCNCFIVIKQDETGQWNILKHFETTWNTMKQKSIYENSLIRLVITLRLWYLFDHCSWFKVFHCHESVCFMTTKHTVSSWFKVFHDPVSSWFNMFQGVSWSCFILIQHLSRCFMILIHPDSTCFKVFHDSDSSWFNIFHNVSWPWNKLFHCWFILIQNVTSPWFILFHADSTCFTTVFTSVNSHV